MEEFGISYFFEHSEDKHVMVLADAKSSYMPVRGASQIPYIPLSGADQRDEEHFSYWVPNRRFRTGKMTVNDYDFTKPSASLVADRDAGARYKAGSLENYDYPGRYTEKDKGMHFANIWLQAEQAADKRISAAGPVPRVHAGALFTLTRHPHKPQNKEYLVVRASHSIVAELYRSGTGPRTEEAYVGRYDVLASDIPFRPIAKTPKPLITGAQTAKVVGEGE